MLLNDSAILNALTEGIIKVDPLDKSIQIQPASIDLTLSDEFCFYSDSVKYGSVIDVKDPSLNRFLTCMHAEDVRGFVIKPKQFVLARTQEYIKIPADVASFVEGRSSIGRLGLFIENAGWIDPGFEGTITLELFNASDMPIRVYPGMRICQIIFYKLSGASLNPYSGKYQGQVSTTASAIFKDFD